MPWIQAASLSMSSKYVLKMTTEIGKESPDELLLYFSSDGGKSFYNEDDPRVATRASEDEIHSRRAEVCTTISVHTSPSCLKDGEVCTDTVTYIFDTDCFIWIELERGRERKYCCSGKFVSNFLGHRTARYCGTCIPSGKRCGYERQESLTSFGGQDTGCVRNSQEWEFPAWHIRGEPTPFGKTHPDIPIGRGKYDKCCSGEFVYDQVTTMPNWWSNREVAYKCK